MRKKERIEPFLRELEFYWENCAVDYRFGQLMVNFLGWVSQKNDPFFPEEEQMLKLMEKYFKEEFNFSKEETSKNEKYPEMYLKEENEKKLEELGFKKLVNDFRGHKYSWRREFNSMNYYEIYVNKDNRIHIRISLPSANSMVITHQLQNKLFAMFENGLIELKGN